MHQIFKMFSRKISKNECESTYLKHFPSILGDLVIHMGDREIQSVSGRLQDNLGELELA